MKIYLAHSTQENNIGVDGVTEENRMTDFTKLVKKYLIDGGADLTIFENSNDMELMEYIEDSNSKNVDLHIEIHSNAGPQSARGFEIYYSNYPLLSQDSKRLAECIYARATSVTDIDRGVFADTRLYNVGLAATRETTAIATLMELFYHTNKDDITEFNLKKEQLAKSIAQGVYNYLDLEYKDCKTKSMQEILNECTYTPDAWMRKLRTIENAEMMLKKVYYRNKNAK